MSVSSLSWVATTAFDDADRWAWDRIGKLGGDPLAGATTIDEIREQAEEIARTGEAHLRDLLLESRYHRSVVSFQGGRGSSKALGLTRSTPRRGKASSRFCGHSP